MEKHYDKIGQEIKVGDLILAYDSFNTNLIFGTVFKLCPKIVKFYGHDSKCQPNDNWISHLSGDRMIVISDQTVKHYAWKMLKEA